MLLHGFVDARHPHLIWMAWSESPFAGSDFCLFILIFVFFVVIFSSFSCAQKKYCVCVNSVCWPCFVGQCLANISLVSGLLRQLLVSDAAFDRAVVVPTLFENPQIK